MKGVPFATTGWSVSLPEDTMHAYSRMSKPFVLPTLPALPQSEPHQLLAARGRGLSPTFAVSKILREPTLGLRRLFGTPI